VTERLGRVEPRGVPEHAVGALRRLLAYGRKVFDLGSATGQGDYSAALPADFFAVGFLSSALGSGSFLPPAFLPAAALPSFASG
jgi:hypothetical protein